MQEINLFFSHFVSISLFFLQSVPFYLQLAKSIKDSQCSSFFEKKNWKAYCTLFFLLLMWLFLWLLIICKIEYESHDNYLKIVFRFNAPRIRRLSALTHWIYGCYYCCCCWCHCDWFAWRCRSGRLWSRRKARLTHWLLTHFANLQLQTLLIWKHMDMFHLE